MNATPPLTPSVSAADARLLSLAIRRFEQIDAHDPVHEQGSPRAQLYGQRMSETLEHFRPSASVALKLAVRAQHIERWTIARNNFAEGKAGYYAWRKACAQHHASVASRELLALGAEQSLVERVSALIRKEHLKKDDEAQALEDVACLVFLRYEFKPFLQKSAPEKIPTIVQKTWAKMSEQGHAAALALVGSLPMSVQQALTQALNAEPT